jgi:hypothetical protein
MYSVEGYTKMEANIQACLGSVFFLSKVEAVGCVGSFSPDVYGLGDACGEVEELLYHWPIFAEVKPTVVELPLLDTLHF